jgi:hypothetical protein
MGYLQDRIRKAQAAQAVPNNDAIVDYQKSTIGRLDASLQFNSAEEYKKALKAQKALYDNFASTIRKMGA